jgi:hypothetical protein
LEPAARSEQHGRPRESIDPDDFRGGFGVWSGTSFSAPIVAARIAASLAPHIADGDDTATALARAMTAVQAVQANPEQ